MTKIKDIINRPSPIETLESLKDDGLCVIRDADLDKFKDINTPDTVLSLSDIGFYHNPATNKYELLDKTIGVIINGDEICDRYNCHEFIKKHILKLKEFKYIVSLIN